MANVLILGGGFGGLITAEKLAAALPPSEHQITLVSERRSFIFYPGLVHVAFRRFQPEDVAFDLNDKLNRLDVRFIEGEVVQINADGRRVRIAGEDFSGEIHYDYLIIAVGRRPATEKTPGFFEYAHQLLGVNAALKFGEAVESFGEGKILVGMCPGAKLPVPICEAAFALAKKFENSMTGKRVSISVVFPETIDDAFAGANLHRKLKQAFAKYDIGIIEDFSVNEIDEKKLIGGGQTLDFDLLMLVPPFKGQVIVNRLGDKDVSDESGFARVNSLMQVQGLERVYAVGDIVSLPGPKLAQMAVQQAKVAASNIFSEIKGEAPDAEYYHQIAAIIDQGGSDSIYLRYGIWDETLYRLQTGTLWSWIKNLHDKYWQAVHLK